MGSQSGWLLVLRMPSFNLLVSSWFSGMPWLLVPYYSGRLNAESRQCQCQKDDFNILVMTHFCMAYHACRAAARRLWRCVYGASIGDARRCCLCQCVGIVFFGAHLRSGLSIQCCQWSFLRLQNSGIHTVRSRFLVAHPIVGQ